MQEGYEILKHYPSEDLIIGRADDVSSKDRTIISLASGEIGETGANLVNDLGKLSLEGIVEVTFLDLEIHKDSNEQKFRILDLDVITSQWEGEISRRLLKGQDEEDALNNIVSGSKLFTNLLSILRDKDLDNEDIYQLYSGINSFWDPDYIILEPSYEDDLLRRFNLLAQETFIQNRLNIDILRMEERAKDELRSTNVLGDTRLELEEFYEEEISSMKKLQEIQRNL